MQKIFRTLIIIAMLITSYLLVLAWQKDYGGENPAPVVATSVSDNDIASIAGDLPVSSTASEATVTQELIDVSTDIYTLKIDPVGGDVVYLALKDYDAKLGSNEPFVLLENQARTYVAQSLIGGRDGIDVGERAIYTSPSNQYQMTGNTLTVPLTYEKNGISFTKNYEFTKGQYPISLHQTINNTSGKDWQGELFITRG